MTSVTHKRSEHIDAPVETVFEYVKDPRNFFGAFPEKDRSHTALTDVNLTPEGVGSTYKMMGRMLLLFHMEWVLTREQYVPNELIVDRASTGGVFTCTFEPGDPTGTTLSLSFGWFAVPIVGGMLDRVSWDGDRDLDVVLANIKKAIES